MEKRIVIAGCRNYKDYATAKKFIDLCVSSIKKECSLIILSGGCKGADLLGERYALENNYKIERYLPEWEKYGKSAGPKRNKKMAENGDYIICFWDGKSKGTKSMIEYAKQLSKPLRVKKI